MTESMRDRVAMAIRSAILSAAFPIEGEHTIGEDGGERPQTFAEWWHSSMHVSYKINDLMDSMSTAVLDATIMTLMEPDASTLAAGAAMTDDGPLTARVRARGIFQAMLREVQNV